MTTVFENVVDKIYYLVQEGWKKSLYTCSNCGELFFIDWENPKLVGLDAIGIANGQMCPRCNSKLENSLKQYPENFLSKNGELSHFVPSNNIPPDDESILLNCWELEPIL